MFRTTIIKTSPELTFSTPQEFVAELENYFDSEHYNNAVNNCIASGKILNITESLDDSKTLRTVFDWDSEDSYIEFFVNSNNLESYVTAIEAAGYTRTTTTETI